MAGAKRTTPAGIKNSRAGSAKNKPAKIGGSMYRSRLHGLGESEIFTYLDLSESEQSDFDYAQEASFIRDAHGEAYCLADFMRPDYGEWYDGYKSADNVSRYLIKFNEYDTVKIFYEYIVYIPDEVAKATSKR